MIKQLTSETVYQNKWMTVREDQVLFPNQVQDIFGVVEKSDFALIVPFEEGLFTLVKQYRYPVHGSFWEFPQGSWEMQPEIAPELLAQKELEEETGWRARSIKEIGYLYEAYGYCNQGFHIFLATSLTKGTQNLEKTESDLEMKQCSVSKFQTMVEKGEIRDAPTVSAYGILKMKGII